MEIKSLKISLYLSKCTSSIRSKYSFKICENLDQVQACKKYKKVDLSQFGIQAAIWIQSTGYEEHIWWLVH